MRLYPQPFPTLLSTLKHVHHAYYQTGKDKMHALLSYLPFWSSLGNAHGGSPSTFARSIEKNRILRCGEIPRIRRAIIRPHTLQFNVSTPASRHGHRLFISRRPRRVLHRARFHHRRRPRLYMEPGRNG